MKYATLWATVVASALGITSLTAQSTVQTVQQFGTAPTPDGWKFSFQISRFLPSAPGDQLVEVDISLSVQTDYPAFSFASAQDGSIALWNVSETVSVKNLKFTADDGYDDDEDPSAVREAQVSTQLSGQSAPLANGASGGVNDTQVDATQPTIVLTNPDDLQRFIGDPNNSPKALNIKIINQQSRSFMFKPGNGTFTPARKDYHPTTSATLVVTYKVQTASGSTVVQSGYSANVQYLITPSGCTYTSTSK